MFTLLQDWEILLFHDSALVQEAWFDTLPNSFFKNPKCAKCKDSFALFYAKRNEVVKQLLLVSVEEIKEMIQKNQSSKPVSNVVVSNQSTKGIGNVLSKWSFNCLLPTLLDQKNMSDFLPKLLDILYDAEPLSLASDSLESFKIIQNSVLNLEDTNLKINLLLAVSIHRGGVSNIINAAIQLFSLRRTHIPRDLIDKFIKSVETCRIPIESILSRVFHSRARSSWFHMSQVNSKPCSSSAMLNYSCISADDSFNYVHMRSGIRKFGSGRAGTIQGYLYKSNDFRLEEEGCIICLKSLPDFLLYRSSTLKSNIFAILVSKTTLSECDEIMFPKDINPGIRYNNFCSDGTTVFSLISIEDGHQYAIDSFLPFISSSGSYLQLVRRILLSSAFTTFPISLYSNDFEKKQISRYKGDLFVGQLMDVQDSVGKWCVGEILALTATAVKIHYVGWASKWDELIEINSPRLARYHEHTGSSDLSQRNRKEEIGYSWFYEAETEKSKTGLLAPFENAQSADSARIFDCGWFKVNPEWTSFDKDISLLIEGSFVLWKSKKLDVYPTVTVNFKTFIVNFDYMTMIDLKSSNVYKIKRNDDNVMKSNTNTGVCLEDLKFFSIGSAFGFFIPGKICPNFNLFPVVRVFDLNGLFLGDISLPLDCSFSSLCFDYSSKSILSYSIFDCNFKFWNVPVFNLNDNIKIDQEWYNLKIFLVSQLNLDFTSIKYRNLDEKLEELRNSFAQIFNSCVSFEMEPYLFPEKFVDLKHSFRLLNSDLENTNDFGIAKHSFCLEMNLATFESFLEFFQMFLSECSLDECDCTIFDLSLRLFAFHLQSVQLICKKQYIGAVVKKILDLLFHSHRVSLYPQFLQKTISDVIVCGIKWWFDDAQDFVNWMRVASKSSLPIFDSLYENNLLNFAPDSFVSPMEQILMILFEDLLQYKYLMVDLLCSVACERYSDFIFQNRVKFLCNLQRVFFSLVLWRIDVGETLFCLNFRFSKSNNNILTVCNDYCLVIINKFNDLLQTGVSSELFGTAIPFFFSCLSHCERLFDYSFKLQLTKLIKTIAAVYNKSNACDVSGRLAPVDEFESQFIETNHPFTQKTFERNISFPYAMRLLIFFDKRSQTAGNSDLTLSKPLMPTSLCDYTWKASQYYTNINRGSRNVLNYFSGPSKFGGLAKELLHCDNCCVNPIRGFYFKCNVCEKYNLCSKCFSQSIHSFHAMSKSLNSAWIELDQAIRLNSNSLMVSFNSEIVNENPSWGFKFTVVAFSPAAMPRLSFVSDLYLSVASLFSRLTGFSLQNSLVLSDYTNSAKEKINELESIVSPIFNFEMYYEVSSENSAKFDNIDFSSFIHWLCDLFSKYSTDKSSNQMVLPPLLYSQFFESLYFFLVFLFGDDFSELFSCWKNSSVFIFKNNYFSLWQQFLYFQNFLLLRFSSEKRFFFLLKDFFSATELLDFNRDLSCNPFTEIEDLLKDFSMEFLIKKNLLFGSNRSELFNLSRVELLKKFTTNVLSNSSLFKEKFKQDWSSNHTLSFCSELNQYFASIIKIFINHTNQNELDNKLYVLKLEAWNITVDEMMMYLAFNSTRFVHRQQSTLLVCDLLRSNLHLNVAPLFFRNYGTSIEDSLNYINEKVFDVGDAICFDLIGDLCNYILKQSSALISSELCQIVLDVSLLPFKLSDANNILRCKLIETIQFCSQPLPPHPDLYFEPSKDEICSTFFTGSTHVKMQAYECITCSLSNNYIVCHTCIQKCHIGHEVRHLGETLASCDCGLYSFCRCMSPLLVHSTEFERRKLRISLQKSYSRLHAQIFCWDDSISRNLVRYIQAFEIRCTLHEVSFLVAAKINISFSRNRPAFNTPIKVIDSSKSPLPSSLASKLPVFLNHPDLHLSILCYEPLLYLRLSSIYDNVELYIFVLNSALPDFQDFNFEHVSALIQKELTSESLINDPSSKSVMILCAILCLSLIEILDTATQRVMRIAVSLLNKLLPLMHPVIFDALCNYVMEGNSDSASIFPIRVFNKAVVSFCFPARFELRQEFPSNYFESGRVKSDIFSFVLFPSRSFVPLDFMYTSALSSEGLAKTLLFRIAQNLFTSDRHNVAESVASISSASEQFYANSELFSLHACMHVSSSQESTSERLSNPIIIVDMICSRLKEFRIANVVSVNNEEDKRDRILNELERSNEALIWVGTSAECLSLSVQISQLGLSCYMKDYLNDSNKELIHGLRNNYLAAYNPTFIFGTGGQSLTCIEMLSSLLRMLSKSPYWKNIMLKEISKSLTATLNLLNSAETSGLMKNIKNLCSVGDSLLYSYLILNIPSPVGIELLVSLSSKSYFNYEQYFLAVTGIGSLFVLGSRTIFIPSVGATVSLNSPNYLKGKLDTYKKSGEYVFTWPMTVNHPNCGSSNEVKVLFSTNDIANASSGNISNGLDVDSFDYSLFTIDELNHLGACLSCIVTCSLPSCWPIMVVQVQCMSAFASWFHVTTSLSLEHKLSTSVQTFLKNWAVVDSCPIEYDNLIKSWSSTVQNLINISNSAPLYSPGAISLKSATCAPNCWDINHAPYCLFPDYSIRTVIYKGGNSRRSKHADDYPVIVLANSIISRFSQVPHFHEGLFYFELEILEFGKGVEIGFIPSNNLLSTRSISGWCDGSLVLSNGRKAIFKPYSIPTNIPENLKVGDLIDVKDNVQRWEPAIILENSVINKRIQIHYLEWGSKYDECISYSSMDRVAVFRTHTSGNPGQLYYEDYASISICNGIIELTFVTLLSGSVIGVLWDQNLGTINFTFNGENLGLAFSNIYGHEFQFFPAVCLHSEGCSVKANFGSDPFLFKEATLSCNFDVDVARDNFSAINIPPESKSAIESFELTIGKDTITSPSGHSALESDFNSLQMSSPLNSISRSLDSYTVGSISASSIGSRLIVNVPELQLPEAALNVSNGNNPPVVAPSVTDPVANRSILLVHQPSRALHVSGRRSLNSDPESIESSSTLTAAILSPVISSFSNPNLQLIPMPIQSSNFGSSDPSLLNSGSTSSRHNIQRLVDIFAQIRSSAVGSMTQAVLLLADTLPQLLSGRLLLDPIINNKELIYEVCIGMKVRVTHRLKSEICSKLSSFNTSVCSWLPAMENIVGTVGSVKLVDDDLSIVLVEFSESEFSQVSFWWIPKSCLEKVNDSTNYTYDDSFKLMESLCKLWYSKLSRKIINIVALRENDIAAKNIIFSKLFNEDPLVTLLHLCCDLHVSDFYFSPIKSKFILAHESSSQIAFKDNASILNSREFCQLVEVCLLKEPHLASKCFDISYFVIKSQTKILNIDLRNNLKLSPESVDATLRKKECVNLFPNVLKNLKNQFIIWSKIIFINDAVAVYLSFESQKGDFLGDARMNFYRSSDAHTPYLSISKVPLQPLLIPSNYVLICIVRPKRSKHVAFTSSCSVVISPVPKHIALGFYLSSSFANTCKNKLTNFEVGSSCVNEELFEKISFLLISSSATHASSDVSPQNVILCPYPLRRIMFDVLATLLFYSPIKSINSSVFDSLLPLYLDFLNLYPSSLASESIKLVSQLPHEMISFFLMLYFHSPNVNTDMFRSFARLRSRKIALEDDGQEKTDIKVEAEFDVVFLKNWPPCFSFFGDIVFLINSFIKILFRGNLCPSESSIVCTCSDAFKCREVVCLIEKHSKSEKRSNLDFCWREEYQDFNKVGLSMIEIQAHVEFLLEVNRAWSRSIYYVIRPENELSLIFSMQNFLTSNPAYINFDFLKNCNITPACLSGMFSGNHKFPLPQTFSISYLVSMCRFVIFSDIKLKIFNELIDSTADTPGNLPVPRVSIDRISAYDASEKRKLETFPSEIEPLEVASHSVLGQLWLQLRKLSPSLLRPPRPLGAHPHVAFAVHYLKESALGLAGPFRDLFVSITRELHALKYPSDVFKVLLPLFLLTPNAQNSVGEQRDLFQIHPMCVSAPYLQLYYAVGQILGIALRTKVLLNLKWSPVIWKMIVGEKVNKGDWKNVDINLITFLDYLESVKNEVDFIESFSEAPFCFVYSRADHVVSPLRGHTSDEIVTFNNRIEYVRLVEAALESDIILQVQSLRRGILSILPESSLLILSWYDLESLVCGSKSIDIEMLARHTEYAAPLDKNSDVVKYFWTALSTFTQIELRKFVKFAFAQESLPLNDEEYNSHPKIRMFIKSLNVPAETSANNLFPKSDTCFFNVSLPPYDSADIMRIRLLTAIECEDMSGDM